LVWNPYCHTSIYSHPEGACLMKVLEGSIIEQTFANAECFGNEKVLLTNDINFTTDNTGIRRFINNNFAYSYSLHIYSPALCDASWEKLITEKNKK
jgi:hypothetical protein